MHIDIVITGDNLTPDSMGIFEMAGLFVMLLIALGLGLLILVGEYVVSACADTFNQKLAGVSKISQWAIVFYFSVLDQKKILYWRYAP